MSVRITRSQVFFPYQITMATVGDGQAGKGKASAEGDGPSPSVSDLLRRLNLTEEEGAVVDFSDDEDVVDLSMEWALVGKVHVNTVRAAMKPAWGNPVDLKIRAVGEKGANLFIAEFGSKMDMEHVMASSSWMVGRHAVILKPYDGRLSASEIMFD